MGARGLHYVYRLLPVLGLCACCIYVFTLSLQKRKVGSLDFVNEKALFWFLSNNLENCEDLLNGANLIIPSLYETTARMLDYHTKANGGLQTGHIGKRLKQVMVYLSLVNASFVNTVCETGFNAGHSALLWLVGNPNVKVYSFDMGSFRYSRPNANFLKAVFPNRLQVIWGDSKVTIPRFTKSNPQVMCDIIFIDGGHHFPEVSADLRNLRAHANPKYHVLSVDDYLVLPGPGANGVTQAWRKLIAAGLVKQHFGCSVSIAPKWAFAIGKYINNTTNKIVKM